MRFVPIPLVGAFVLALAPMQVSAQAMESAEPFHVATFEVDGAQMVGLILRDQLAVEIEALAHQLGVAERHGCAEADDGCALTVLQV